MGKGTAALAPSGDSAQDRGEKRGERSPVLAPSSDFGLEPEHGSAGKADPIGGSRLAERERERAVMSAEA